MIEGLQVTHCQDPLKTFSTYLSESYKCHNSMDLRFCFNFSASLTVKIGLIHWI